MRKLFATLASTALLLGCETLNAGVLTPERTLTDSASFVLQARKAQLVDCVRPRTNTPRRCNNDFDAYVQAQIEFCATQLTYLITADKKEGDERKVKELKEQTDNLRQRAVSLLKILERDYFPLSKQTSVGR